MTDFFELNNLYKYLSNLQEQLASEGRQKSDTFVYNAKEIDTISDLIDRADHVGNHVKYETYEEISYYVQLSQKIVPFN